MLPQHYIYHQQQMYSHQLQGHPSYLPGGSHRERWCLLKNWTRLIIINVYKQYYPHMVLVLLW